MYVFLIVFRLYLAGIVFCQYCFYHSFSVRQTRRKNGMEIILLAVMSANIFLSMYSYYSPLGEEAELSYGYNSLVQERDGYAVYETDNALPLAFLYDHIMRETDYNMLDVAEKQQVMMQVAVIEDGDLARRGEHSICLQYHTPFLQTGLVLMAAGAIGCGILLGWGSRGRQKKGAV